MKRMMFGLLIIIMTLMGGSACMKKENINDMAIKYMEQKYGETFEYYAPAVMRTSSIFELFVTSPSYPEDKIHVEVENYRTVDKIFRDNYLAVKYKEKTREFFTECVGKYFDGFKLFYDPSNGPQSETLPADSTFEDYLNDTRACIVVFVIIKESDLKDAEQAEKLGEMVSKKAQRFTLNLLVISDSDYTGEWESYDEFYLKRYPLIRRARISNSNSDSELRVEWVEVK